LNNILAKIQANFANVDAAVMLDNDGFVAELNDTNIFLIKDNQILTPNASACLPGITRQSIIEALSRREMLCIERQISLTELYNADLVFASGSKQMGAKLVMKRVGEYLSKSLQCMSRKT
jgi:branched-chain amino acid aminotransferase